MIDHQSHTKEMQTLAYSNNSKDVNTKRKKTIVGCNENSSLLYCYRLEPPCVEKLFDK